jgi:hypothetical protein
MFKYNILLEEKEDKQMFKEEEGLKFFSNLFVFSY